MNSCGNITLLERSNEINKKLLGYWTGDDRNHHERTPFFSVK